MTGSKCAQGYVDSLALFRRGLAVFASAGVLVALGEPAQAAVPADYAGTPFDPAVVGGVGIIPATVEAGPFPVPGRIDLVNYDMGGEGVGFHSEAHYTTKDGDGYRTDRPTATMCLTLQSKPDVWYDTSAAQDGMFYPTSAVSDFYIGSIHPNDWFNYTVDVKTAGTYKLSSSFATGNGPPGGEGGDGQMELIIFVNGVQQADWKATFPDFENKANFHNWKAYPDFAMLTLDAGLQVIKIQAPFKHLNLDYVELELVGGSGGGSGGGAGVAGAGGSAGGSAGGASGIPVSGGAGGASGGAGSGAGNSSTSGNPSAMGSGGASGGAPAAPGGQAAQASQASAHDGGGCTYVSDSGRSGWLLAIAALLGACAVARRRGKS